jgi:hypothetical protein
MNALTQLYSVNSLTLNGRKISFDDKIAAQYFPLDRKSCQFVVVNPSNILEGPLRLVEVIGKVRATLTRIEYTAIGMADGERLFMENYFHDFTSEVVVNDSFVARATSKSLFIPYELDVVLDTKNKFPKVTAVQFIA